ncbi:MAG: ABC transporter ATP-binding protein [Myxococcales bacterium]|nr:ABC transporter ATP-binding protein [Myxococcales bacterium]
MNEPADAAAGKRGGVAIEAQGLTRRFGPHVALDGLDLRIAPGEAFGLLGANGAGKTTFIRLVTGFLLPSAGTVTVDGMTAAADPAGVSARIGFVAETTRLYPELRVGTFLRFAGGARGLSGSRLEAQIDAGVARFQLESSLNRPLGHLSKGLQQRVNLAQAFLHDPPLLIVDEPTSGLDPLQQEEVRSVLRGLRGERTLILCTHDLGEARELTERVAVLSRGKLVACGPTREVLSGADPLALFRGENASAA